MRQTDAVIADPMPNVKRVDPGKPYVCAMVFGYDVLAGFFFATSVLEVEIL